MKVSLIEWISTGTIAPFHWGMSLKDLLTQWPSAQAQAEELLARGYPFFVLDGIEFYFQEDDLTHLCEVVIKTLCLSDLSRSPYFEYGWLRADLTWREVRKELDASAIPYVLERGPSFQTPNLRTIEGVVFAFDPAFERDDEAELLKVYLAE